MVKHLLATHELKGMSIHDVNELLGPPDSSLPVGERSSPAAQPSSISYRIAYMGFNKDFAMGMDYALQLTFRDGHVSEAYVHD